MSDAAALRTEQLTKHYGPVRALQDLTITVEQGEVFGFLGPNGAGKTTSIRTFLDLLRPTSGRAEILGLDSHRDSLEIRRHIGYLPSDAAFYPKLTGHDLVRYFANLRGGVDTAYVAHLAERLNADLSRKIGELSSGNRQKMGLIQAFMNRPELLILDEPSTGLDPLVQQQFQAMVREVAADGRTVFLSSHTLSEVERVADRVGIIRSGHLVVVESMELLKQRAVRRVTFQFAHPMPAGIFDRIAAVRDLQAEDSRVTFSLEGPMTEVLQAASPYQVVNIESDEADLEEIFLTYYRDIEPQAVPA